MKTKLFLFAFLAAFFCSYSVAQTDVTSTYLVNAGFDDSSSFTDENQTTADPGNVQFDIVGWEVEAHGGWAVGYVFEFGSPYTFNNSTVPDTDKDGASDGGVLAMSIGWGNTLSFAQTVTLPEGQYRLVTNTYNVGTKTESSSVFGWIPEEGSSALSTKNSFAVGTWEEEVVEFFVSETMSGKIQVGFKTLNVGSGDNPKLVYDDVKLYKLPFPEELSAAAKLLNDEMVLGDNDDWDDVYLDLNMPTSMAGGVSVAWTSSKPNFITTSGKVTLPVEFDTSVKLTAVLSFDMDGETYTVTKVFSAYLFATDGVAVVARWNFADETIQISDGQVLVKALDTDGEVTDRYVGSTKNEAYIRTIGDPEGTQFNVLYLDEGTGYFDLGAEIGKTMYQISGDYTMSAFFRVDDDAPEQTAVGNFLWCFSNTENAASNNEGYMFMRPTEVRWAITQPKTGEQTVKGDGGTSFYANQGLNYSGVWHHIMYVQFENTGAIYLDGQLISEKEGITFRPSDFAESSIAGEGTPFNWLGRACFATDRYLRKAMIYDFQILGFALSDDDVQNGLMIGNIPEVINDLEMAYYDNPDYKPEILQTELDLINISEDILNGAASDFDLPKSANAAVTTTWSSNNVNVISIQEANGQHKAVVNNPLYPTFVKIRVTLTYGIHQVSKEFEVTVLDAGTTFEGDLLVHYDFSQVSGRTVTDVAEKGFKGTLMNEAGIQQMEAADGSLFNVLSLGNGTGYFDLGYEIGQIMYNTTDYTLSAFYYVNENYEYISSYGNFLWNFSNTPSGGGGQYIIAILRDQRVEMKGASTESFGIRDENNAYVNAPKGEWKHFAYTQEGTLGVLYIDGLAMALSDVYNIPADFLPVDGLSGTPYNWLGRSCYDSDVYLRQSYIYDFRMYNRALQEMDFQGDEFDVLEMLDMLNGASPVAGLQNVRQESPYKVFFRNGQLVVEGLIGGEQISLYDTMGRHYAVSAEHMLTVQPGIYVVKIDNYVTKVLVK